MTREDIIRWAREAHKQLVTKDYPGHTGQLDAWTMRLLERFANLVAAHEREECAKLCDDWHRGKDDVDLLAEAIRARGQQ